MDKTHVLEFGIVLVSLLAMSGLASAQGWNGYNRNMIFVGTYTQWCVQSGYGTNSTCSASLGSSGNDLVVMKWNAQWNNCNIYGGDVNPTYCAGAWVDNEFNGKVPGGDNTVWHYKIIWVGPGYANSTYWLPGGYSVWGNYEVVMDQGLNGTTHVINAVATPNGYGA